MIKDKKLDHIGLAVPDVEKNAKWYQDILGFTIKGKFESSLHGHHVYFLQSGDTVYEMFQSDNMNPAVVGKIDHIAYHSDDIEADYQYCVDQGYKITTNGVECCPTFWEHGCKYFKIESPCGEQIEFCQNP